MNTKHRIIQFIDSRAISRTNFFNKTGIRRGLLDSNKMDGTVSDRHLAAIIQAFPELNLEWLVTGNGSMLKPAPVTMPDDMVSLQRYEAKMEECIRLRIELETLKAKLS